jgi:uncharacterized protein YndB with AHSA1/START domain
MTDVTHEINAVTRTVGGRTLEAGEATSTTIARTYNTDLDDLWDACTNAERIPRWFLPISGDLRLGGSYQLEGNAGGKIEHCDPPHAFSATWEYDGSMSWIEVRLTAESPGKTRFELTHIAHINDHWREFGPGAAGVGWDGGLFGLARHLESGQAVDQEAAMAWMVSEEGRQFFTLAGEGWYEAHVASGEDPQRAREMADRTIASYTTAP